MGLVLRGRCGGCDDVPIGRVAQYGVARLFMPVAAIDGLLFPDCLTQVQSCQKLPLRMSGISCDERTLCGICTSEDVVLVIPFFYQSGPIVLPTFGFIHH